MDQDQILENWERMKDRALHGSVSMPLPGGFYLLFLYHSSLGMLEVYTVTVETMKHLCPGQSPAIFESYDVIEVEDNDNA